MMNVKVCGNFHGDKDEEADSDSMKVKER